jgi:hypothetical protein
VWRTAWFVYAVRSLPGRCKPFTGRDSAGMAMKRSHASQQCLLYGHFGSPDKAQRCRNSLNPAQRFVAKGSKRLDRVYETISHTGGLACRRAVASDNTRSSIGGGSL